MLSEFRKQKFSHIFNLYDFDGSGLIERKDFMQVGQAYAQKFKDSLDSAQIQKIGQREMEFWGLVQARADLNGDGKINQEEFCLACDKLAEDKEYVDAFLAMYLDSIWMMLDIDQDRRIGPEEFTSFIYSDDQAMGHEVFAALDTNSNGFLTKDEILTAWKEFFYGDEPSHPSKWVFGKF